MFLNRVQVQVETVLASFEGVETFMHMHWSWPTVESIHFIGLTLLLGSIAVWDLRLIGLMKGIPIVAFHRLVPFAVAGFATNVASGSLFLMTEPDQYVYNPAFHFKMLCLALAGLNVAVFYLTTYPRLQRLDAHSDVPRAARLSGMASLGLWVGVIIFGRLITFYRPIVCEPGETIGFLAHCIIR